MYKLVIFFLETLSGKNVCGIQDLYVFRMKSLSLASLCPSKVRKQNNTLLFIILQMRQKYLPMRCKQI